MEKTENSRSSNIFQRKIELSFQADNLSSVLSLFQIIISVKNYNNCFIVKLIFSKVQKHNLILLLVHCDNFKWMLVPLKYFIFKWCVKSSVIHYTLKWIPLTLEYRMVHPISNAGIKHFENFLNLTHHFVASFGPSNLFEFFPPFFDFLKYPVCFHPLKSACASFFLLIKFMTSLVIHGSLILPPLSLLLLTGWGS